MMRVVHEDTRSPKHPSAFPYSFFLAFVRHFFDTSGSWIGFGLCGNPGVFVLLLDIRLISKFAGRTIKESKHQKKHQKKAGCKSGRTKPPNYNLVVRYFIDKSTTRRFLSALHQHPSLRQPWTLFYFLFIWLVCFSWNLSFGAQGNGPSAFFFCFSFPCASAPGAVTRREALESQNHTTQLPQTGTAAVHTSQLYSNLSFVRQTVQDGHG
ncbi:hypothetical protein B0T26DRAFT_190130 [Lasiosphaeria miniovina]|uniref:Uncharacterized protein n=1 Tax=Lasiosphaeria miniovina TaxID=1954250 RepID=A0AA40ATF8_9PEZI|nr:uncharacterized protein B0T26DRAFT_190130 [Lasiosphaeria miniovina]KAK0721658.1 hypothetical protein B0T26DRAFT_190130 [Lasiosphaeria miniovina]